MTDRYDLFLSYSHNDLEAATNLRRQLERRGLTLSPDDQSLRAGGLCLNRLQEAVDGCGSFVVLVGRDGVRRSIGAETQAALSRHFDPRDHAMRLPIFPILLGNASPEALPALLRGFRTTRWNGSDPLPEPVLDQIRERAIVPNDVIAFEGCPFVGLGAFRPDQAELFLGRQKETLDALACFDTRPGAPAVRWLEIIGNSGAGKSSLMNAGLLPLVDQGWLWPRIGFERCQRIGPMTPGERPVAVLAEHLARTFALEMADARKRPEDDDEERSLAAWLRGRAPDGETAFLLAIDQFEELFTLADPAERARFDRLLAGVLEDAGCPLFVISTMRADFLDRFEELPRLVGVRNRRARPWTLPPISADGLREIISGPARLAGLDVSEVTDAVVAEAQGAPGALPLVQNALHWLWKQRTGNLLSGRLLAERGGLAGTLSHNADALLQEMGEQRGRALELLSRLVKVDPEGWRHTSRRIRLAEAVAVAGGGERGRALVDHLAGTDARGNPNASGPLRLITVTEEAGNGPTGQDDEARVNLIHETLIRSKGPDAEGKPQPYWPTLWRYIEQHEDGEQREDRAAQREGPQLPARQWRERKGFAHLFGRAGWPRAAVAAAIVGLLGGALYWATGTDLLPEDVWARWIDKWGTELPMPELVEIPGGTFTMGSEADPGEQPVHPVTLTQTLHLGTNQVTFAQYDAFARATGRALPDDSGWGRDDRPVINVDWSDARAYAQWLGETTGTTCRLPSEAEWEYACRAGTTTAYALPPPGGSDDIAGKALANCIDCGSEWDGTKTAPAASFPANAWGLHDMHGNVWEWVEDCWHSDYDQAPEDGSAWPEDDGDDCNLRVMRGGSWRYDPVFARCAARDKSDPANRFVGVGFRVGCSSPINGR